MFSVFPDVFVSVMEAKCYFRLPVIILFLLSLQPLLADGQQRDCNPDFLTYHSCVFRSMQNHLLNRTDPQKIHSDTLQCFAANGCRKPLMEDITAQSLADRDRMRKCYKDAQEVARNQVQKCMVEVKSYAGFSIPKDNAWQSDPSDDPRTEPNTNYEARRQVAAMCPSPESRSAVRKCLNDLRQNSNRFLELKQKCQAAKNCYNGIPADCRKKFDQSTSTVCECASQTLGNLYANFDINFKQCYGRPTQDDNKLVGYLIRDICHLDDECVEPLASA